MIGPSPKGPSENAQAPIFDRNINIIFANVSHYL
jgi:hypothetical protein